VRTSPGARPCSPEAHVRILVRLGRQTIECPADGPSEDAARLPTHCARDEREGVARPDACGLVLDRVHPPAAASPRLVPDHRRTAHRHGRRATARRRPPLRWHRIAPHLCRPGRHTPSYDDTQWPNRHRRVGRPRLLGTGLVRPISTRGVDDPERTAPSRSRTGRVRRGEAPV